MSLLELEPCRTLLDRLKDGARDLFAAQGQVRISRAPGRLDVMGGIADYTGSLVCEMPLGVGTAVALQARDDRQVCILSLNLLDAGVPFELAMPLASLARASADDLRRELAEPGRKWAAYVLGCLFILHEKGYIDLAGDRHRGLSLAIHSTIPIGGGVSSSAALEVAAMVALVDHFGIGALGAPVAAPGRDADFAKALRLATLCQEAENRIVGAPCGIMDQVTCLLGEAGTLLRLLCQPHELQPPLPLPPGVAVAGIFTGVRHDVAGDAYARTRAAAFMGRRMMLEHMRRMAADSGREMSGDPMRGYLANLPPEDYKALFRPILPEAVTGRDFLDRFGNHGDAATTVVPQESYPIQHACDHHVLEARRVRRFADFIERADEIGREKALRSAGHLMYASHLSYGEHAGLGHPAADALVNLVKRHEPAGLYGARITGGGSGGTVAVLLADTPRARAALASIMEAFEQQTGHRPTLLDTTSPGAAHTGSELLSSQRLERGLEVGS